MASEALQSLILSKLDVDGLIQSTANLSLGDGNEVDQQAVYGALSSLWSREFVTFETLEDFKYDLTAEGKEIVASGSHEVKVFNAIPAGETGLPIAELAKVVGEESAKVGQGRAFKNKWIKKVGASLVRDVASVEDQTAKDLATVQQTHSHPKADVLKDLVSRKLINRVKQTTYKVAKGPNFSTSVEKQATDITPEMLASGSWKNQSFKKYNFAAEGQPTNGGALHPLMKVREELRQIFFELGFTEMPTNHFVESSFWNFDALFQPQQHPSRDMHDTFFLSDPASDDKVPQDYLDRVAKVHSKGGYGSVGYGYEWDKAESEKLILRTHTTARSSYMLYQLAQEKEFRPAKYFSIDRVFRNETVDATHLAEFHQVEGLIADRGLTLGHLIGFLGAFFEKMGISPIKFKPAYNPYTEPSMEIFSYHQGLKKWVEVGNSGMFRPEMLRPMGLPEDVGVIAWGLSLERPTMIKYGIDNIRELLGHKCDIAAIQNSPVIRFDKKTGKELLGESTRAEPRAES